MTPKLSNLNIVLSYWNENSDSCFRFNNPKQCSNWIILVSFGSFHLAIKIATMFILWNLKNWCKNRFFCKKFKKVCVLQRRACNKFKISLSRKLQRFRTCHKNKKCSIFYELFEYQQKRQLFFRPDWSFKPFFYILFHI